ncbi:hypothetical protein PF003_g31424 [Phytophthora fragariae]|nr:hypothetical protein PF003_g31424 [Phytophthora fragariae]
MLVVPSNSRNSSEVPDSGVDDVVDLGDMVSGV